MQFIYLSQSHIQQLIMHNKAQIRELETERQYLEHIIQLYWNSCDPIFPKGVLSSTAFSCLNKAKDDLIVIKKKIKMLATLQYQLKYAIR